MSFYIDSKQMQTRIGTKGVASTSWNSIRHELTMNAIW